MVFKEIVDILSNLSTVVILMVFNAGLYPMAKWVFPRIKNRNINALIHLVYGLTMSFMMFGYFDTTIMIIFIVVAYFLLYLRPLYASLICFGMTMLTHLYIVMQGVSWALDITGLSMVVFQKLCSLSFNIQDGRKIAEGTEKLHPHWVQAAVLEKPNIFIFFAYCITPYGSFSNPFIEFKVFDYMLNIGSRKEPLTDEDNKLALKRFIEAYICSAVTQISFSYVGYEKFESDWYYALPLIVRLYVIVLNTLFTVIRYFCSWWAVESGLYAFGLASSGIFPTVKTDISNLSMLEVLDSRSVQEWFRRWNHSTHLFWKNYLYTRMRACGYSSSLGNVAVFVCSMSWHGCRPVYLMMLPEAFIFMETDKILLKKFPLTEHSSIWAILMHDIFVSTSMLYVTSTFFYPWVHEFFHVRKTVYFFPTIFSIVMAVVLSFIPSKGKKGSKTKDNNSVPENKEKAE